MSNQETLQHKIEEYRALCKAQPPMNMEEKMTLLNQFFEIQNMLVALAPRDKLVSLGQHVFGLYQKQIEAACKANDKRAFHGLVESFLKDLVTIHGQPKEEANGKEE